MARTDSFRDTEHGPAIPTMGTLPTKANTLYPKGTIVTSDTAGLAISPGTADASGFPAQGVSKATFDNRTGQEMGGLDSSGLVEVDYGVFGFDYTGTPHPGDTMYVVDNQTVSDDSDSGGRGVAGVCSEVRTDPISGVAQCFVWMGPHVADLWSDDSALGTAVTNAEADIDALEANALTAKGKIDLPILSGVLLSTGVGINAAAPSGAAPGTAIADSKSTSVKWLANATPGAFCVNVPVPADLDDTEDVIFHAHVSKSGATLGDAVKLTVAAFEVVPTALHDADVDFGGDTDALVGNATAKTVTELTLTFAAANIHAYAETLSLQIKVKAGLLGTDNAYLHGAWLEYTKKLLAA